MHPFVHVMPRYLTREGIRHQAQVEWPALCRQVPALCRQVSDVGNQDLPWRHRSDFHRAGFEQVGMAIETLKTVERLVIGPFGLHQQTVLGQYPKQSVPPDRQPSIVLALQQIMLLVDAHP